MNINATIKVSNIDRNLPPSLSLDTNPIAWQGAVYSLPLTVEGFAAIDRTIRAIIAEFGGYTATVTIEEAAENAHADNYENADWTPGSGLDITSEWLAHRFNLRYEGQRRAEQIGGQGF